MEKPKANKQFVGINGFDVNHIKKTEAYVQAVSDVYWKAILEFTDLSKNTNYDPSKLFEFKDYPGAKAKADKIVQGLASKMQTIIDQGSEAQWLYACEKNDALLNTLFDTTKIKKETLSKFQDKNLAALNTFQKRKVNGLGLSDRVWNYANQMKDQMEMGIDIALGEGKSAAQLSRDLRQYLVDPDKLFRRVRDKHGNLVLSKKAKAFHPGVGKYRSSYKNAMRLTRTEINMAYRESDRARWQHLDFIVGYEVKLSNNHTLNGEPFVDICDRLKGKYPKDFKFVGWHPQCRCHAVPIMQDPDEFDTDELNELKSAIHGTEYNKLASKNTVTDVPQEFKEWVKDNEERAKGWKSQPYFIKDNYVGGNIDGGLKFATTPQKAVKTVDYGSVLDKLPKGKIFDDAKLITGLFKRSEHSWSETIEQFEKHKDNAVLTKIKVSEVNITQPNIQAGKVIKMTENYNDVPVINAVRFEDGEIVIYDGHHRLTAAHLLGRKEVEVMLVDLEKLNAADKAKDFSHLNNLLVDANKLVSQYGEQSVQSVYDAVQIKLSSWSNLTLEEQKDKLVFEIQWVEKNQKYETWKAAQDAYKKQLTKVLYQTAKEDVKTSIQEALTYAKGTKSPVVKSLADEIQVLLSNDAPIAELKQKAAILNKKANSLIAENARNAKKTASVKPSWTEADYTKERKDAALWARDGMEADNKLRDTCGQIWRGASKKEKEAAYYYTHTFCPINEPLRGMTYYGPPSKLKEAQAKVPHLTSIIDRSFYDFDMWVQRGVKKDGFEGLFGVNLNSIDKSNLDSLVGKTGLEKAFSSCGIAKGKGFTDKDIIYNIYCPRGTRMFYEEPFSDFGNGAKLNWDGVSKQSSISLEAEILIQRNTKFRITKIEYNSSQYKYYVDVEVIEQ